MFAIRYVLLSKWQTPTFSSLIYRASNFWGPVASDEYSKILSDAICLEKAGVTAVVLESIVSDLAAEITETLKIPTIGIGSGTNCDGQIRVIHDITGNFPWFTPPFAKPLCNIADEISSAVKKYIQSI